MKALYKIGMLAVAALAFAGCAKEVENPFKKDSGVHTLTFTVQKDIDTRTAVVEGESVASYIWREDDSRFIHVYENGIEATALNVSYSTDYKIATIKATFANSDATSFSYRATYGSDLASSKPHNPLIPAKQSPLLSSFDPAADVLVSAEDIVLEGNAKADENTEFLFRLNRVVSVNKMTLKGLTPGETIQTVMLKSSDGYFSARYVINDGTFSNTNRDLTFDYTQLDGATVGTDGTFPVYFTSAPVSGVSFSVVVTTDQHVYTRDNFTSKLTLSLGEFRRFGINLADYGEAISTGTQYKLVETQSQLVSGATYIIVGNNDQLAAMGEQKSNNRGAVNVTADNKTITIDNTIDASSFTIVSVTGGYTIQDNDTEQYLYTNNTTANRLLSQAEAGDYAIWSINISEGVASIVNVKNESRGVMCYNGSGTNQLFACYEKISNTYNNLSLYIDESSTTPSLATPTGLEAVAIDNSVLVTWNAVDHADSYTVTCGENEQTGLTVCEAEFENMADGTYEVTVTAISNNQTAHLNSDAASTTVTVGTVAYNFRSIAELNALGAEFENNQTGDYSGVLTNAIVSFVPDKNNAIIKDGTASILVYVSGDTGHGLLQGQTFSGELNVTVKMYNTTYEITDLDASFTGSETEVLPATMTLDDLVGNFATYQNTYVKVENLTVEGKSGNNFTVSNGGKSYIVYDSKGQSTATTGDVISVIGTVGDFKGTNQIKAWASSDIVITYHPISSHTITFTQPTGAAATAGCSFSVKVDGNDITSGTSVQEGKTVTLEATAGTGYTFTSWNIIGATASGNTSPATFVVGTSNVEISAVFTSNTGGTLAINFENAADTYSDWSFSNIQTQMTNSSVTAHGGSYFGTTTNSNGNGVASDCYITTVNQIEKPSTLTFYVSKQSTNTSASTWVVKVSEDGESWTQVGNSQNAGSGINRGTWYEVSRDLSSFNNVYVRIEYSGSTAIRCIDDVSLTYN